MSGFGAHELLLPSGRERMRIVASSLNRVGSAWSCGTRLRAAQSLRAAISEAKPGGQEQPGRAERQRAA